MGRFSGVLSWALSLLGAFLAVGLAGAAPAGAGNPLAYILWSGLFFLAVFLGGFVGLQLSLALNRHGRARRSRGWFAALVLSGALIFGAGAGGQALFMLSREEVTTSSAVDMALLLDASGSMDTSGYSLPRTDAAVQFVEAMGEDTRIQAVSFASTVLDSTDLLTMDAAGRQTLVNFIKAIDAVGMTDFDAPLSLAADTLLTQGRADSNKAILLLTDGEGTFSSQAADTLLENGIRLFSIRIDAVGSSSAEVRALTELAERTGGFDTRLVPGADGSVDTAALLQAFQEAFQATSEHRMGMKEELLIRAEGISGYQLAVRFVTLILCALLFGVGYFAQWRGGMVVRNALSGALLAVLLTLAGGFGGLSILLICLLLGAAYVKIEWKGGGTLDV